MFSPSHHDWSLHRKGPVDQARHHEKVREAIKQNLPDIIADESIITSDGKRLIKVPIRTLEEYRFRFNPYQGAKVGQGDGDSAVGDVLGPGPGQQGRGQGGKAGQGRGGDFYEAEVTVDDLAELIFEDLGLPDLRPKQTQDVQTESVKFTDIRKRGPMANLDKKRTIMENLKRNALHGLPGFGNIQNDDLRFKVWEQETRPSSAAVVLAMRDASGSMGEFKKYITRSLFFWMVRFLRTKYQDVEIVFIVHHSDAHEVDEESFFHMGESGGTKVSSAYQLCYDIIEERYDPARWNIYPFHFSDGENCATFCMTALAHKCGANGADVTQRVLLAYGGLDRVAGEVRRLGKGGMGRQKIAEVVGPNRYACKVLLEEGRLPGKPPGRPKKNILVEGD